MGLLISTLTGLVSTLHLSVDVVREWREIGITSWVDAKSSAPYAKILWQEQ